MKHRRNMGASEVTAFLSWLAAEVGRLIPAMEGPMALRAQLWLFWLAPIVGAVLGALAYKFIASEEA